MLKKLMTAFLILVFLAGLGIVLYPTIADGWNSVRHSKVISTYKDNVSKLKDAEYKRILEDAHAYNKKLAGKVFRKFVLSEPEQEAYESLLNVNSDGMMGYIDIPKINVNLPIYHGTNEGVLQFAAGHIEWTSLPVGGLGSHAVISGHRGVPSSKLLSNIDQLSIADYFVLHILNETLTYQVDNIQTVLPQDIESIQVDPNEDYCTLITCTPYGINTHRLLVRGHRVPNLSEEEYAAETQKSTNYVLIVSAIVAILIIAAIIIWRVFRKKRRGDKQ